MGDRRRDPRLYTLGIDPGKTTGWAVMDHRGVVRATGNWAMDDVLTGSDDVIRCVNRQSVDLEIVQEVLAKGRDGTLANDLKYVQTALTRVIEDTYDISRTFVLPGTWKNSRHALAPLPFTEWEGEPLTLHQRDAINLCRWRMANRSPDYKPRTRFLDMPGRHVR